jgi:histidine phosphotransferase ChpT
MTASPATPTAERPGTWEPLRLAELLATRLCHDLSGAVGAAIGALDLAAEDAAVALEATALARGAAHTLAARLRLLRAAWGGGEAPLSIADLREFARGLPGETVKADFNELQGARPLLPQTGRLLLNVMLLAAESLPGGGTVALCGDIRREVMVLLDGARAAWPPGLALWLVDPQAAWEAIGRDVSLPVATRRLQGPLTALIAHEVGLRIVMPIAAGRAASAPPLIVSMTHES